MAAQRRTPVRLDRDIILAAAQAVADRDGAKGLTLRRVGAELGADPTALYRHFRSKDELMVAMADRLFGGIPDAAPGMTWRENLRDLMLAARGVYHAHPAFVEALANQPDTTPNLSRIAERSLSAMLEAGLSPSDAALFDQLMVTFVAGTSVCEVSWEETEAADWRATTRRWYAALPPDDYPNCTQIAHELYPDPDVVFLAGVEILLDAIEARINEAGTPRRKETERA